MLNIRSDQLETATEVKHDSQFSRVELYESLMENKGEMLAGKWKNETIIYLYHFPEHAVVQKISLGSNTSLKNNSSFSILNVSIFSKDTKKEVLSVKKLSPNKSIKFEFNREGSYELLYSIANNKKAEKRNIKVIPQLNKSS
jgi:hypothetical protein